MKVLTIPVGMTGANCHIIVSDENSCAVIDPGAQPEKIIGEIKALGATPKYILLTHGHFDHIGGVKRLMAEYPDAVLHIGEKDIEMLADTQKSYAYFRSNDINDYVIEDAVGLSDGQSLPLGGLTVTVMETPGHTLGGVVYFCLDAMFSGDTIFAQDVGRTDLYGGNFDTLKGSLLKLAAMDGDYALYPGHGGSSTLERERRSNPYLSADTAR